MKKIVTIKSEILGHDGKRHLIADSIQDACSCEDCESTGEPCSLDCDRENECAGCRQSRLENEEELFETDCAQGRR